MANSLPEDEAKTLSRSKSFEKPVSSPQTQPTGDHDRRLSRTMSLSGQLSADVSPAGDNSSPQNSSQWSHQGMDNSQQAILSEEALLLHTRDLFSFPSEFFDEHNQSLSFIDNSEDVSPRSHAIMPENAIVSEIQTASSFSSGERGGNLSQQSLSADSYMNLYGNRFIPSTQSGYKQDKASSQEPSESQLPKQSLNQQALMNKVNNSNDDKPPKRPRSPTILEAAAMAAEIIASENNPGQMTAKKPRPCDSCRRRKARCIMLPSDTGRCLHCEVKKQPCTFLEAPVRRPRNKKNSSSQTSRPKVQSTGAHTVGNESAITETEGSLIEAEGDHAGNHSRTSSEANLPRIRYEDYASLGGHNLLKKALSLQYPRSSYYIGPTSVFDLRLLEATPLDHQGRALLSGDIELRKVSNDVMFSLKNDYSEALYERSIQNVDSVEMLVAPHGRTLIDLYFRIIHPSFPILHKKVFIEKYERTHREFMAPLLAAVYILALNWWNYDPALSAFPKPDVEELFQLAIHTFSDALDRPKLSSVQAGLLLLQCQPNHNRNWMLCSQVVALTEELGIGLDSGKWRLPLWERGLRRRLSWGVWLQDKWLSLSESRPSHIDRLRTWHIRHVNAEDFPERHENDEEGSAEVETGRVLFMEFIKLTEIVEDMSDNLFTVRSVRLLVQTERILQKIKPLQIRLKTWYQNLPTCLSMSVSRPRKLSSNGSLHLAYFAAEITLHRRIIHSLNDTAPPMLTEVCRNAARQRLIAAMEFVRNLRPEHLQAFWYSSSAFNFALIGSFAALLYVTSINPQESAFYKSKLRDYRWVLRVSSNGFEPMAAAMRILDIALCRVPQLLEDPSLGDPSCLEDETSEDKTGMGAGNDGQEARSGVNNKRPVLDDDEEGDGEEDFTNETPRHVYTLDDPMNDEIETNKTDSPFAINMATPSSKEPEKPNLKRQLSDYVEEKPEKMQNTGPSNA